MRYYHESSNCIGMCNIGGLYEKGLGVEKDYSKAMEYQIYLVGTYLDDQDSESNPKVTEKIEKLASQIGAPSFKISIRTGEGVVEMMETVSQRYITFLEYKDK